MVEKSDYINRQSSAGFTLIETAIVVFIACMILSLSLSYTNVADRYKLKTSASIIAEDIRLAQQLNMNQDNYLYTVLFDCYNERYYILKNINTYKIVTLPAGIDLVQTNFDFDNTYYGCDNKLRFNIKGEPCNKSGFLCGGHLMLRDKNGNNLYVIVASKTGRVRIDSVAPES